MTGVHPLPTTFSNEGRWCFRASLNWAYEPGFLSRVPSYMTLVTMAQYCDATTPRRLVVSGPGDFDMRSLR